MNKNDELLLKITGFGACGTARHNGFVIFADGSCPGDTVRVKIERVTKNCAFAKVLEVITPSKYRVKPFCALQNVCGACQMQFIDYDYQLKLKRQIVQDAVERIAGLDITVNETVPSPKTKEYRHKVQYPVSQTPKSERLKAGYYKAGTHDIVNIKHCPIQPEICDEIIEFIRANAQKYGISACENRADRLRHIVLRISAAAGSVLVTLVTPKLSNNMKALAKALYDDFDCVSGVCINLNSNNTNVILGKNTICAAGNDYIEEHILNKTFHIGPNTFFQVNPESAQNIFKYVKDYISRNFKNPVVLDAYAGIAAFGICIADVCSKVVCVEENPQSCELARLSAGLNSSFDMNFNINNINPHIHINKNDMKNNIEINNEDTEKFLAGLDSEFDAVILDPPRKGCTKKSLDEVFRLCRSRIIYISCNPATLARDLKYLVEKGAHVESLQPFDMFCHTVHVETAAIIRV